MVRVVVLYDEAPDGREYEAHAEVCRLVPGGTFRHGPIFGSPIGEPAHRYIAEWEFSDQASFEAGTASDEFRATGRDARDCGLPRPTVEFATLS